MSKKILVVVEGEKKEVQLFQKLQEVFIPESIEITSYKSSLYKLYDYLEEYCDYDFEDLDFLEALKEHEPDANRKKIFDVKYTDILLIFDFDPQDDRFDIAKITKLMEHFSESTEAGKLYINYPMVESFYHLRNIKEVIEDARFRTSKFTMQELSEHQYKKRVADESRGIDIAEMYKRQLENIMLQHSCKANFIVDSSYKILEDYSQNKMRKILHSQNKLLAGYGEAYILNTCAFFILENYPSHVSFMRR